jgi:uncharacterized membrane protein
MTVVFKALVRRGAACFLAGVFATLPLIITVAVVIWVAGVVGGLIGPETFLGSGLESLGMGYASNTVLAYVIGWAMVLGVVFVVGVFVELGAKRILSQLVEVIVKRIPIIGGIYGTSKQLVGMLDKKDEADLKGMSVVFCTFGQQAGCGLLALLVSPHHFQINGREYVIVIVPTAPVPIGGGLLFIPADSVIETDVSVDGLMSIYVSMGVTAPEFLEMSSTVT